MKLPAFEHERKQWDAFKQFHMRTNNIYGSPFVQFESGEFMIDRPWFRPKDRREYENLGIAITFTSTSSYTFFMPDGVTRIPAAWLNYDGGQMLMVDTTNRRAYKLTHDRGVETTRGLPTHARNSAIYFANVDADPICRPVLLHTPDNKFKEKHKAWFRELVTVCRAVAKLKGLDKYQWGYKYKVPERLIGSPMDVVVDALSDAEIASLEYKGIFL